MASTRPPGTYSPSARTGRRGGGSGGVGGMVRRAGSDAPVDSSAASIPPAAPAEQLSPQMMGAAVRRCGQGRRRRAKGDAFPRPGLGAPAPQVRWGRIAPRERRRRPEAGSLEALPV